MERWQRTRACATSAVDARATHALLQHKGATGLTTPYQQTSDARERSRQASSWAGPGRAKRSSFLAPRRAGLTLVDAALGQESLELRLDTGRLQQHQASPRSFFFRWAPCVEEVCASWFTHGTGHISIDSTT